MTITAEQLERGWQRHDIVYSPELKMYGTIRDVKGLDAFVEWQNGSAQYYRLSVLDEWQKINDERERP